jgi:hypothetical protein
MTFAESPSAFQNLHDLIRRRNQLNHFSLLNNRNVIQIKNETEAAIILAPSPTAVLSVARTAYINDSLHRKCKWSTSYLAAAAFTSLR